MTTTTGDTSAKQPIARIERIRSHSSSFPLQGRAKSDVGGGDDHDNKNRNDIFAVDESILFHRTQLPNGLKTNILKTNNNYNNNNNNEDNIGKKDQSTFTTRHENKKDGHQEQQQSHQQQSHQQQSKLTAIVHIGPQKTASSSIQRMMTKVQNELYMDGYERVADINLKGAHGFASCFRKDYPFHFQYKSIQQQHSNQYHFTNNNHNNTNNNNRRLAVVVDRNNSTESTLFHNNNNNNYINRTLTAGGIDYTCYESVLQKTYDIASIRNHHVIISSETLSNAHMIDHERLYKYLHVYWTNILIVAVYRRFYQWLVSFHNQHNKYKNLLRTKKQSNRATTTTGPNKRRNTRQRRLVTNTTTNNNNDNNNVYEPVVDWLTIENIQFLYDNYYIVGSLRKYKQFFSNIKVYNFQHDQQQHEHQQLTATTTNGNSSKEEELVELFYCNALKLQQEQPYNHLTQLQQQQQFQQPNRTCEKVRNKLQRFPDFRTGNSEHVLVYKEMAQYAIHNKLIPDNNKNNNNNNVDTVANKIEYYNEITMNRTRYEFGGDQQQPHITSSSSSSTTTSPLLQCPNATVLEYIWQLSIEAEMEFLEATTTNDYYYYYNATTTTIHNNTNKYDRQKQQQQQHEEHLRNEFLLYAKTKLCTIRGVDVIENNRIEWYRFFQSLSST